MHAPAQLHGVNRETTKTDGSATRTRRTILTRTLRLTSWRQEKVEPVTTGLLALQSWADNNHRQLNVADVRKRLETCRF